MFMIAKKYFHNFPIESSICKFWFLQVMRCTPSQRPNHVVQRVAKFYKQFGFFIRRGRSFEVGRNDKRRIIYVVLFNSRISSRVGDQFSDWIIENEIVEKIFGPNIHVEVLKQAHLILHFLSTESKVGSCDKNFWENNFIYFWSFWMYRSTVPIWSSFGLLYKWNTAQR